MGIKDFFVKKDQKPAQNKGLALFSSKSTKKPAGPARGGYSQDVQDLPDGVTLAEPDESANSYEYLDEAMAVKPGVPEPEAAAEPASVADVPAPSEAEAASAYPAEASDEYADIRQAAYQNVEIAQAVPAEIAFQDGDELFEKPAVPVPEPAEAKQAAHFDPDPLPEAVSGSSYSEEYAYHEEEAVVADESAAEYLLPEPKPDLNQFMADHSLAFISMAEEPKAQFLAPEAAPFDDAPIHPPAPEPLQALDDDVFMDNFSYDNLADQTENYYPDLTEAKTEETAPALDEAFFLAPPASEGGGAVYDLGDELSAGTDAPAEEDGSLFFGYTDPEYDEIGLFSSEPAPATTAAYEPEGEASGYLQSPDPGANQPAEAYTGAYQTGAYQEDAPEAFEDIEAYFPESTLPEPDDVAYVPDAHAAASDPQEAAYTPEPEPGDAEPAGYTEFETEFGEEEPDSAYAYAYAEPAFEAPEEPSSYEASVVYEAPPPDVPAYTPEPVAEYPKPEYAKPQAPADAPDRSPESLSKTEQFYYYENRSMNKSMNDLVNRYFAQSLYDG